MTGTQFSFQLIMQTGVAQHERNNVDNLKSNWFSVQKNQSSLVKVNNEIQPAAGRFSFQIMPSALGVYLQRFNFKPNAYIERD